MARNFTTTVNYDGKTVNAVILPALRQDGMHYEVNIAGFPRFFMKWSVLDRFDIIDGAGLKIPDALLLAISDAIEANGR